MPQSKQSTVGSRVIGLSLTLCILLASSLLYAGPLKDSPFLGLFTGIDKVDGSLIQVLISPSPTNPKKLELRWYETYWTICDGNRGIETGTAKKPKYGAKKVVFKAEVTCFSEDGDTVNTMQFTEVFERVNDALIINNNNEEKDLNLPFYRVSESVRKGFLF